MAKKKTKAKRGPGRPPKSAKAKRGARKAASAKVAPAKAIRKPTVHAGVGAGRPSRMELLVTEELRKLTAATERQTAVAAALLELEVMRFNSGKPADKCFTTGGLIEKVTSMKLEDAPPRLAEAADVKEKAEKTKKAEKVTDKPAEKLTAGATPAAAHSPASAPAIVAEAPASPSIGSPPPVAAPAAIPNQPATTAQIAAGELKTAPATPAPWAATPG